MKKYAIIAALICAGILTAPAVASAKDHDGHGERHEYQHGYDHDRGYHRGDEHRGGGRYYAPQPYYHAPYYPQYREIWVAPHWEFGPYGQFWVPGHWVRTRC